jgi:hypothetical protein
MDIQGYIAPTEEHPVRHYAEVSSDRVTLPSTSDFKPTSSIPSILPTLVEEDYTGVATASNTIVTPAQDEPTSSQEHEIDEDGLNPALLLNRYDKRKSSPAILGLPFGLNHEAQLSLHLSQQRNSIEAAMLLANFNKLLAFPKVNELEHKGKLDWKRGRLQPEKHENRSEIMRIKKFSWASGLEKFYID